MTSLSHKADINFCWNKWELVNSKLIAHKSSGSRFLIITYLKYNLANICWYKHSILLQNITKLTYTVDKLSASDWLTCDIAGCLETEFRCRSTSRCISVSLVCNGVVNCADFSDESTQFDVCGKQLRTCMIVFLSGTNSGNFMLFLSDNAKTWNLLPRWGFHVTWEWLVSDIVEYGGMDRVLGVSYRPGCT